MIKTSFAGCGLVNPRDKELFHSDLKTLIEKQTVSVPDHDTGITDDEEDDIVEADVVQDE